MQQIFTSDEVFMLYADIMMPALKICIIFGLCNIVTDMILNAFMYGRLRFGGRI